MNSSNKIMVIYTAMTTIAVFVLTILFVFQRGEHLRYKSNYENLVQTDSNMYKVQDLLKKEFKAYYPKLDSIAKAKGIQTRKIESITNVYHKTVFDTISFEVIEPVDTTSIINVQAEKECFKALGQIDISKTGVTMSPEQAELVELKLLDVQMTDSSSTFYFWDRNKVKILFFKLKIGKKRHWAESTSKCGSVKIEHINIVKKGR